MPAAIALLPGEATPGAAYSTHYDRYGRGGLRVGITAIEWATTAARDIAVPSYLRVLGMEVKVTQVDGTFITYELTTMPGNFTVKPSGGGGGAAVPSGTGPVLTDGTAFVVRALHLDTETDNSIATARVSDFTSASNALINSALTTFSGSVSSAIGAATTNMDASAITTGTFGLGRIPTMDAAHIPGLDAAKLVTGILQLARIPVLDAAHYGVGSLDLGSNIFTGFLPTALGGGAISVAQISTVAASTTSTIATSAPLPSPGAADLIVTVIVRDSATPPNLFRVDLVGSYKCSGGVASAVLGPTPNGAGGPLLNVTANLVIIGNTITCVIANSNTFAVQVDVVFQARVL